MDFVRVPFIPGLLTGSVMAVQEVRGFLVEKKTARLLGLIFFDETRFRPR